MSTKMTVTLSEQEMEALVKCAVKESRSTRDQAALFIQGGLISLGMLEGVSKLLEEMPRIVCLCGSTRFYQEFQEANYRETMNGNIVLSVGFYPHSAEEAHGESIGITKEQKIQLDELHLRKIDLADEILVLNVNGYVGESTYNEVKYAIKQGKTIRWLEDHIDLAMFRAED